MPKSLPDSPETTEAAPNKGTESPQKTAEKDVQSGTQKDSEIGGPKGPEPTRFGDWEQKGRCSDF